MSDLTKGLYYSLYFSSTHNQRIERLWVEVGTQFARQWRAFFTRLEEEHRLDALHSGHLWLLHQLFLEDIQYDAEIFRRHWNHHGITGSGATGTRGKTPKVRLCHTVAHLYLIPAYRLYVF